MCRISKAMMPLPSQRVVHCRTKFTGKGMSPIIIFARIDRPVNALKVFPDGLQSAFELLLVLGFGWSLWYFSSMGPRRDSPADSILESLKTTHSSQ